jgi:hypothetical protein
MYPNYEQYWTAIQDAPNGPNPIGVGIPMPAEVEWARVVATTPHYVASRTLTSAQLPMSGFLRGLDEVAALKQQPAKDIYLMGGAEITRACLEADLVDEFRLIVYPLMAGEGTALFTAPERHGLDLRNVDTPEAVIPCWSPEPPPTTAPAIVGSSAPGIARPLPRISWPPPVPGLCDEPEALGRIDRGLQLGICPLPVASPQSG